MQNILNGSFYRDKSKKLYQIITEAIDEEFPSRKLVIYQTLSDDFSIHAIPKDRFVVDFIPESPQNDTSSSNDASKIPSIKDQSSSNSASPDISSQQKNKPEAATQNNNSGVNPDLLAFLDAENYEEKLEIFEQLRNHIDSHVLNAIAVSLDFALPEGTCEEQYDHILYCLTTHKRFETNRLR